MNFRLPEDLVVYFDSGSYQENFDFAPICDGNQFWEA